MDMCIYNLKHLENALSHSYSDNTKMDMCIYEDH